MTDRPEGPRPRRRTRPWRGEGRTIERALLVGAGAAAGAVVAAVLGMSPVLVGGAAAAVALAAATYRR
jgi:hypothetical protein